MATIENLVQLQAAGKLELGQSAVIEGILLKPNKGVYYYMYGMGDNHHEICKILFGGTREANSIARVLLKDGYMPNGFFPYCKSIEDLYKLIMFMYQCSYTKRNLPATWEGALIDLQLVSGEQKFIDRIQYHFKSPLNTKSNEPESIKAGQEGHIIVSRVTPAISRGPEIRGSRVSGKLSKATTRVGYLVHNQGITGS